MKRNKTKGNGLILYGIKNCNTVKAAIYWLEQHDVPYDFYDYKVKGVTIEKLKLWSDQVGWESLLNKRGTTWKQLESAVQERIVDAQTAFALLQEKTSLIKRPLMEEDGVIIALGFEENVYSNKFS
jgi:Spx/MgsR family transcriptional regulator